MLDVDALNLVPIIITQGVINVALQIGFRPLYGPSTSEPLLGETFPNVRDRDNHVWLTHQGRV